MLPWTKLLTEFDAPRRVFLVMAEGVYLGAFSSETLAVAAAAEFAPNYSTGVEIWVDEVNNPTPVARRVTAIRCAEIDSEVTFTDCVWAERG
jgi:hypothetical protein